jgi:hypothetical protein
VPDDVVGELGVGAWGRDLVPVKHGGSPYFHWWFRPSRTVAVVAGGVLMYVCCWGDRTVRKVRMWMR